MNWQMALLTIVLLFTWVKEADAEDAWHNVFFADGLVNSSCFFMLNGFNAQETMKLAQEVDLPMLVADKTGGKLGYNSHQMKCVVMWTKADTEEQLEDILSLELGRGIELYRVILISENIPVVSVRNLKSSQKSLIYQRQGKGNKE